MNITKTIAKLRQLIRDVQKEDKKVLEVSIEGEGVVIQLTVSKVKSNSCKLSLVKTQELDQGQETA